jgi:hypothetical protein
MQIGSLVVCVDDVFPEWAKKAYTALPVKGEVYTVREMAPGRGVPLVIKDGKPVQNGGGDKSPEIQILLMELKNPPDPFCAGREMGFKAERFAPIEFNQSEETIRESIGIGEAQG